MFKYILKRLGLSIIVLLGVSVIIYFLVRLMPADYLETKFSAQLQQGTITYEQLDEFKKKYGLYMPEAYVDVELSGGSYENESFRKDTKEKQYDQLEKGYISLLEFYAGTYTNVENESITLVIDQKNGAYRILEQGEEAPVVKENGMVSIDQDQLVFQKSGSSFTPAFEYEVASIWDKIGAVFSGYFSWLGNMLKGDMGDSFLYQKPVNTVIAEHMWISFLISLVALIFQFAIAIPMGITSATHQYSGIDYTVTVVTMIGISLPSFFFAALLIKIFSNWLGWFPTSGLVSGGSASEGIAHLLDMGHHLVLPMLVLIVLSIGGLMRYTRTNMLEVLNSDYIRTARAKGLSEKKVIYVHAFRNTMIPLMTLLAGILPSLFGGAMITEEVFSIDGIGRLAYKALQQGDVPFIMGYNMFLAVLTVIGTLFSDLMYAVVDPRVKLV